MDIILFVLVRFSPETSRLCFSSSIYIDLFLHVHMIKINVVFTRKSVDCSGFIYARQDHGFDSPCGSHQLAVFPNTLYVCSYATPPSLVFVNNKYINEKKNGSIDRNFLIFFFNIEFIL